MSDDRDDGSKSEEPTDKKIGDALQKGNVPLSREVITFGGTLGIYISVQWMGKLSLFNLTEILQSSIISSSEQHIRNSADLALGQWPLIEGMISFCAPVMLIKVTLSAFSALLQNKPQLTLDRIAPKLDRISPRSGLRRLFGWHGALEFLKVFLKLVIFGSIVSGFVAWTIKHSDDILSVDGSGIGLYLFGLTRQFLAVVLVVMAIIGIADLFLARFRWKNELRMTRKELKDELKESEGDPLFKSHRRSLALQRSRNRMISAVPTATMIIANPTHYAVALRYVKDENAAPTVVAKGRDKLALRIREIAESSNVPIVENKLLARSLYGTVAIDQQIPADFYQAVATIIVLLQRRR